MDTAQLEARLKAPGLTVEDFDALCELNGLELQGPPPPPDFIDNGCGPKLAGSNDVWWKKLLGRAIEWAVRDQLYGYSLRLPCRLHDFQWNLAVTIRLARARSRKARQDVLEYLAWLGLKTEDLWQIEIRKADADAFFRHNIRQYLACQGAGAFMRWRVSLAYWLGVRFGAGIGEA